MKISEELIKRASKVLSQENANGHGVCPDPATFEEGIRVAARVFEAAFKDKPVDDGGLAFPGKRYEQVGTMLDHGGDTDEPTFGDILHPGMSLRDWFAGQADVPWNAVIETLAMRGNDKPTVDDLLQYRAEVKYLEADAMIAARKAGA